MRWLWLVFLSLPAVSQVTTGSISGFVMDPSNRPIQQSTVMVSDANRAIRKSAVTDSSGFYRFENLPPSTYELSITATGFNSVSTPNVRVEVNADVRVDVRPQID